MVRAKGSKDNANILKAPKTMDIPTYNSAVWELTERLYSKSMEIKWTKYMKVDPELRSLWLNI